MHRVVLPFVLVVAACEVGTTPLPSSPGDDRPPEVTGFEPGNAYAGWLIRVSGNRLGDRADALSVEFGGGAVSRAASLESGALWVRVPLDATDGPLTLVNESGRSEPSEEPFEVDGRGAPENPQPLVRADLRAALRRVIETDDGLLLHDRDRYLRAARADFLGNGVRSLPGDNPIDVARVGFVPVVLDVGTDCSSDLVVVRDGDDGPSELARITLTEPEDDEQWCLEPRSVTGTRDGLAVVLAEHTAWVVDPFEATPVLTRLRIDAAGLRFTSPVAHAGGERFVAGAEDKLVLIDRGVEGWRRSVVDASLVGDLVSVGANDDGRVVALSEFGELGIFEVGGTEPRFVNLGLVSAMGGTVALSDDGDTAAVASADSGRVVTYTELLDAPLPVASVVVEEPARIERASRGRWLVAARGGVVELAQRTGQELGTLRTEASLLGPVVRRLGTPSSDLVVEIVSQSFRRLRRFDARSLYEDTEALPFGGPVATFANALFAAPGGRSAFLEVERLGIEQYRGKSAAPRLLPLPEGVRYGDRHAVAYDESLVVAQVELPTELDRFLAAWDPDAEPPVAPTPVNVGFHGYDFLYAGEGRVLGVHYSRGFDLLDGGALRRGERVFVGRRYDFTGATDSFTLVGAGLSNGHAVVVGTGGFDGLLRTWVLRLSDGAEVATWLGRSRNPIDAFTLLPSLRFHWWTAPFDGTSRLSIGTFDPETGAVDGGEARTVLPGGNLRIAPDLTGETLYALDPEGESLTVVQ